MRIAIIGAGIAGLVVAEKLVESGLEFKNIDIFEKSKGLGGRLSTRYHDDFIFDHGAPFFTARSERFRQWLAPKIHSGLIVEWSPKVVSLEKGTKPFRRPWFEPHYVALGQMNRFGKALASDFHGQIFQQKTVVSLVRDNHLRWFLDLKDNNQKVEQRGPYDIVLMAIPGPQAKAVLTQNLLDISSLQSSTDFERFSDLDFFERHQVIVDSMSPEYTLMLGFDDLNLEGKGVHWQLAKVSNSAVSWISVEDIKPGRNTPTYNDQKSHFKRSVIVRSTREWAEQNINRSLKGLEHTLIEELSELMGFDLSKPDFSRLHRWMYAQSTRDYLDLRKSQEHSKDLNGSSKLGSPGYNDGASIYDAELGLGVCGDWLISGDVESAYLSAHSLADRVSASQ